MPGPIKISSDDRKLKRRLSASFMVRAIVSNRILVFLSRVILVLTLGLFPEQFGSAQQFAVQTQEAEMGRLNCSQRGSEQNVLIREAERGKYANRRVEFVGNQYTRDWVLRRRIITSLQEGDLFRRQSLISSLQNVSKLKVIYPVRLRDVVMQLDRSDKTVDLTICLREKRRRSPISFDDS